MRDWIDDFLNALTADGKSSLTVQNYRTDLNQLAKYFDGRDVRDIKYADLRKWVNWMEQEGCSASTRARKIASARSFFRHLMCMSVIDKNPSEGLKTPKQERKEPVVISEDDSAKIIEAAKFCCSGPSLWYRDYSIVSVFLYTGIRREELSNIKLSDVNLETDSILIHGKGNKQRTVYMNYTLHAVLSEYIMFYRKRIAMAERSEYLFPSVKSERMSVGTINYAINKMMDAAGIKQKGVSVHVLRKRFATTLFNNTHDIGITSKMLGHSSPTVTMRYVAMSEEQMRKAAATVNF